MEAIKFLNFDPTWDSCHHGTTSLETLLFPPSCSRKQTPLSDPRYLLLTSFTYLIIVQLIRTWASQGGKKLGKSNFLKYVTVCHNLFLSVASLLMHMQIVTAMWTVTTEYNFDSTICTPAGQRLPNVMQKAMYVFLWSKLYELMDTFLIAMRGRPLIFLHVWHHFSVMFEVWGWLHFDVTVGLYGMMFNTFVHIFMYGYYAAAVLKIPFPFKRAITTTQIVQFMTGFCSLIPYTYMHLSTPGCTGVPGLVLSGIINASYLILFAQFFRSTYMKKKKTKTDTATANQSETDDTVSEKKETKIE